MKEYTSVNEAIHDICGENVSIERTLPISGGDINDAYACILSDGSRVFMKSNRRENLDFFRKEAEGLFSIQKTHAIKTPAVLAMGTDGNRSFLLLGLIESKNKSEGYHENFGRSLAMLHSAPTDEYVKYAGEAETQKNGGTKDANVRSGRFGFIRDNYIGAGYQVNEPRDKWIDFFRDCRLKPQFERTERYFDSPAKKKINRLMEKLDGYLIEPEAPSLLHGDLWSGNYMTGDDGEAWLIDPAAYVGHAEADIAMTELFGGFHRDFYASYNEAKPMQSGYEDRKEIYNLYHLLNHLNLFGGSYLYSVQRVIDRYARL